MNDKIDDACVEYALKIKRDIRERKDYIYYKERPKEIEELKEYDKVVAICGNIIEVIEDLENFTCDETREKDKDIIDVKNMEYIDGCIYEMEEMGISIPCSKVKMVLDLFRR